ncbi:MAG: mechanosensitive ion channel, partial [Dehalococcoidia bacterium]|nr:mechanosensitive ion channel [Dehalococcoidia bacterium]
WRPSLGGFGVALGVAGAGIAFALQEVITSVAGWFAISFAGFYKPGDRVQLGGIKGDVIDVGLLRTTVMEIGEWVSADLYNGRVVRIANSFVFKEPVFNYSGDIPFLWDEVMFPIRYGSDWKLARDTLTAIGNEVVDPYRERAMAAWQSAVRRYQLENVTLEPMVAMLPTDNWIEMRLRYIVDYRVRRKTQDMIATRMLEAVDGSEGRIQFASQTIQVVAGSQISVDRPT